MALRKQASSTGIATTGLLPLCPIAVDDFSAYARSKASLFFLTHCHADHYVGLGANWGPLPVYCSPISKKIIVRRTTVSPSLIKSLEVMQTHLLSISGGNGDSVPVEVTLLPADHCPGAVMILFKGYFGTYLHTGDFRYTPTLRELLRSQNLFNGTVNRLFCDLTFCNPFWEFPSREVAIDQVLSIIESSPPSSHIYVEGEMLGVEPIVKSKVQVNDRLQELFVINGYGEYITTNDTVRFHVCPVKSFSSLMFQEKGMRVTRPTTRSKTTPSLADSQKAVFIKPSTQWFGQQAFHHLSALAKKPHKGDDAWHVLYSIHSSYSELCQFVSDIAPASITAITQCGDEYLRQLRALCRHRPEALECTVPPALREKVGLPKSSDSRSSTSWIAPNRHKRYCEDRALSDISNDEEVDDNESSCDEDRYTSPDSSPVPLHTSPVRPPSPRAALESSAKFEDLLQILSSDSDSDASPHEGRLTWGDSNAVACQTTDRCGYPSPSSQSCGHHSPTSDGDGPYVFTPSQCSDLSLISTPPSELQLQTSTIVPVQPNGCERHSTTVSQCSDLSLVSTPPIELSPSQSSSQEQLQGRKRLRD